MKAAQIFDHLSAMRNDGTLTAFVRSGLIGPKAVAYLDMYIRVKEKQRRLKRTPRKVIIIQVAEEYRVSTATVYRAINLMELPLHVQTAATANR